MKLVRLARFNAHYLDLAPDERQRVDKALRFLVEDWRHPSLHVKRVRGTTEEVWEARASLSLRITFQLTGDTIILRNVGAHNHTLRNA